MMHSSTDAAGMPGVFTVRVTANVLRVCQKALGRCVKVHLRQYHPAFEKRRRKQVWAALYEALQNAAHHGSGSDDTIRLALTPAETDGWLKATLHQTIRWLNWDDHLGPKRRAAVHGGECLRGGAVVILWMAETVEVDPAGVQIIMHFSPAIRPNRPVQSPLAGTAGSGEAAAP